MTESLDSLLGLNGPNRPNDRSPGRPPDGPDGAHRDGAETEGGAGAGLRSVPLDAIQPNERQPRREFDDEELSSLATSVAELGVLQPVLVREIGHGRYELIAGERRWRAARRAGLRTVPAIVRAVDDRESLEQAIVENMHRSDLNVLEESAAYRQLIDEFGLTQDVVAQRVGKSRSAVANTLRLLQLPRQVQRLIIAGDLSAGHARALLALPDPDRQVALADRVVKQGLAVREVEDLVRAAGKGEGDGDGEGTGSSGSGSHGVGQTPPAGVLEIEDVLAERLDTRVKVVLGRGRGRLQVEFADLDDLDRIYRLLNLD